MENTKKGNPCNECIITTMCKVACDEFDLFIKENTMGKTTNKICAPQCIRLENATIDNRVVRRKADDVICLRFKGYYNE